MGTLGGMMTDHELTYLWLAILGVSGVVVVTIEHAVAAVWAGRRRFPRD